MTTLETHIQIQKIAVPSFSETTNPKVLPKVPVLRNAGVPESNGVFHKVQGKTLNGAPVFKNDCNFEMFLTKDRQNWAILGPNEEYHYWSPAGANSFDPPSQWYNHNTVNSQCAPVLTMELEQEAGDVTKLTPRADDLQKQEGEPTPHGESNAVTPVAPLCNMSFVNLASGHHTPSFSQTFDSHASIDTQRTSVYEENDPPLNAPQPAQPIPRQPAPPSNGVVNMTIRPIPGTLLPPGPVLHVRPFPNGCKVSPMMGPLVPSPVNGAMQIVHYGIPPISPMHTPPSLYGRPPYSPGFTQLFSAINGVAVQPLTPMQLPSASVTPNGRFNARWANTGGNLGPISQPARPESQAPPLPGDFPQLPQQLPSTSSTHSQLPRGDSQRWTQSRSPPLEEPVQLGRVSDLGGRKLKMDNRERAGSAGAIGERSDEATEILRPRFMRVCVSAGITYRMTPQMNDKFEGQVAANSHVIEVEEWNGDFIRCSNGLWLPSRFGQVKLLEPCEVDIYQVMIEGGLRYRKSKKMKDISKRKDSTIEFGKNVYVYKIEDGWAHIPGGFYLPMEMKIGRKKRRSGKKLVTALQKCGVYTPPTRTSRSNSQSRTNSTSMGSVEIVSNASGEMNSQDMPRPVLRKEYSIYDG